MTLPVRRFCSTQAVLGRAIQTARPLTAKRTSVASAWRVAMATTVPFQEQCSSSPVQRSVTLKSSYIATSLVPGGGDGQDGCPAIGRNWFSSPSKPKAGVEFARYGTRPPGRRKNLAFSPGTQLKSFGRIYEEMRSASDPGGSGDGGTGHDGMPVSLQARH